LHSKAKGFEIGCELGFYKACSQTWLFVIKDSITGEGEKGRSKEFGEIAAAKAMMDTTAVHRFVFRACVSKLGVFLLKM